MPFGARTICTERGCGRHADSGRCQQCRPKVTLVWGPPASGKTTFVNEHRKPGDVVWDYDAVMRAIAGDVRNDVPGALSLVLFMRDAFVKAVMDDAYTIPFCGHIWIIETAPRRIEREKRIRELHADVVFLNVPKEECLRRAATRSKDSSRAIATWFREYEP